MTYTIQNTTYLAIKSSFFPLVTAPLFANSAFNFGTVNFPQFFSIVLQETEKILCEINLLDYYSSMKYLGKTHPFPQMTWIPKLSEFSVLTFTSTQQDNLSA